MTEPKEPDIESIHQRMRETANLQPFDEAVRRYEALCEELGIPSHVPEHIGMAPDKIGEILRDRIEQQLRLMEQKRIGDSAETTARAAEESARQAAESNRIAKRSLSIARGALLTSIAAVVIAVVALRGCAERERPTSVPDETPRPQESASPQE